MVKSMIAPGMRLGLVMLLIGSEITAEILVMVMKGKGNHSALLPESTEWVGCTGLLATADPEVSESFTSTKEMDLLPEKWIFQRVPLRVAVPVMVVVEFAANFNVSALLTDLVKLLNVVSPERIWLVPFNTTVPPPAAKVPLLMKLPETVVVPLVAVKLPLLVR